MADHEEHFLRIQTFHDRIQNLRSFLRHMRHPALRIEGSSGNHYRFLVPWVVFNLILQSLIGIHPLLHSPGNRRSRILILHDSENRLLRTQRSLQFPEGDLLFFKRLHLLSNDGGFRVMHLLQFVVRKIQQFLQRQLLINRTCSVQCCSIRSLHTRNTFLQIRTKRMRSQRIQIVQADIGSDLEFQGDVILLKILQKFFSLLRPQTAGI